MDSAARQPERRDAALGGHAIPLDAGSLEVMRILGLATDEDVAGGVVPGLERAIAKSNGIEFASLLQQLGADFAENPFAPELREKLLEIEPEARSRLPKRGAKKKAAAEEPLPEKDAAAKADLEAADAQAADVTDKPKKKAAAKRPSAAKGKPPGEKTAPSKKKKASENNPHDESGPKKTPSARLSKRKPR